MSMMFQPRTIIKPPDKGSFPLDHDNECKDFTTKYMKCLKMSGSEAADCRQESKDYLECRMQHNLMKRESWDKLGYADLAQNETAKK